MSFSTSSSTSSSLREAWDKDIFEAARRENVVVMTKDSDFVLLLESNWTTTSSHLGYVR